jgi:SHS2 domain-containing protein
MIKPRAPIQYDFAANWESVILPLINKDRAVRVELNTLKAVFEETVEALYEEESAGDPVAAKKQYARLLRNARARYHELEWLRQTFDGLDLEFFILALARALHPHQEWFAVANAGTDSVITDRERSLVFDIMNFDQISGAASLALAQDEGFFPAAEAIQEAHHHRQRRGADPLRVF